jgi:hypothetical protein
MLWVVLLVLFAPGTTAEGDWYNDWVVDYFGWPRWAA